MMPASEPGPARRGRIRWERLPTHFEQEARKGAGAVVGTVRKTGTKRVPYHAYDGRGKLLGQTSSVQAARALVEKAADDA